MTTTPSTLTRWSVHTDDSNPMIQEFVVLIYDRRSCSLALPLTTFYPPRRTLPDSSSSLSWPRHKPADLSIHPSIRPSVRSDIILVLTSSVHFLLSSRLRPGALPQGAQGLQAHPHQGVRLRRPRRHLQPSQDPQVSRGGRPRLQPEGVREHGCRG